MEGVCRKRKGLALPGKFSAWGHNQQTVSRGWESTRTPPDQEVQVPGVARPYMTHIPAWSYEVPASPGLCFLLSESAQSTQLQLKREALLPNLLNLAKVWIQAQAPWPGTLFYDELNPEAENPQLS